MSREHTIYIAPDYQVKSVTVTSGGIGYLSAPTVTFTSNDGGYGATGIAKLTAGVVTAVQVTNPGKGYTVAPTVSFSSGTAAATAVLTDGVKYPLDVNNDIALLTEEGFGLPPIQHITQRGPFQHGESLRDYFLRPRVIQLLLRRNSCSRNNYWSNRLELLDVLRPNRLGGPCAAEGVLRRIITDGRMFDLKVTVSEGPGFAQVNDVWDRFSYQEIVRFVANDPVFYNPVQKIITFEIADTSLVFGDVDPPATTTFGWTFGYGKSTATIINYGTWFTYPTIRINGPMNSIAIINNTTGKQISIGYAIPAGSYILVELTPGRKSVQLNDGTNLIGVVSGDLATFRLDPGTNSVEIRGTGSVPLVMPVLPTDYHAMLTYYERYYGI